MKTILSLVLTLSIYCPSHATVYTLHTVQADNALARVRITNLSDEPGLVRIVGYDDMGERYGDGELNLTERASTTLTVSEIEQGAVGKDYTYGIGNGSGNWQLELDANVPISAISFLQSYTIIVLAEAMQIKSTENPTSHFMRVHEILDRNPPIEMSGEGIFSILNRTGYGDGRLMLLGAYDWTFNTEINGIELGWSTYQPRYKRWLGHGNKPEISTFKQYIGYLDHAVFAAMHGMINGTHYTNVYSAGNSLGCYEANDEVNTFPGLPEIGTAWVGVAVFVTEDGQFKQGEARFEVTSIKPAQTTMYGEGHTIAMVSAEMALYDVETGKILYFDLPKTDDALVVNNVDPAVKGHYEVSTYGSHCEELAGWFSSGASFRFAFGARRINRESTITTN